MSPHHLTPDATALLCAVQAVTAGAYPAQAARTTGVALTTLLSAVEVYHQAGRAALEARSESETWLQTHIEFSDWERAESIAAERIAPTLDELVHSGLAARWWFIRKHPHWRFRVQAAFAEAETALQDELARLWRDLVGAGTLSSWQRTIYEPEVLAFGGPEGMKGAHDLFSSDSRELLAYFRQEKPPLGRREVSILLCTKLFRDARLDWFEIGDVWHRVAALRPFDGDAGEDRVKKLAGDLASMLELDTCDEGALFKRGGVLSPLSQWASTFGTTGAALSDAALAGTLERGVGSVLAQHVIFHWNRLGLSAKRQAIIAHAAETAVLGAL
jgi:thiopeptide-type bacteriocin biosynthesis protein